MNRHGIRVKKCCASCAHKELTRAVTVRFCRTHQRNVLPGDCCGMWRISSLLEDVGRDLGRVKQREYLI